MQKLGLNTELLIKRDLSVSDACHLIHRAPSFSVGWVSDPIQCIPNDYSGSKLSEVSRQVNTVL